MSYLFECFYREAKAHSRSKDLVDSISDFGEVMCARCNSTGTKVGLSVAGANLLPVPKFYVWDIETDVTHLYSFSNDK